MRETTLTGTISIPSRLTIAATMRTEQLLQQSQALAEELQNTNAELQEKLSRWLSATLIEAIAAKASEMEEGTAPREQEC